MNCYLVTGAGFYLQSMVIVFAANEEQARLLATDELRSKLSSVSNHPSSLTVKQIEKSLATLIWDGDY